MNVNALPRVCAAVLAGFVCLRGTAEVVVENESLRLVLADAGYATSLVCKETGEECLAKGMKMPFCTLTQYRPYDNENFLIHPAKPTTYPANRITREGDRLVVEFAGTADVAYITIRSTPDYVGFVLERLDFKIEDFGIKRKTETDEFALVRLPIARRTHFGEWLNVMWDERTAVTLLGDAPETRIDAFAREDGAYEFYAGMENRVKLEGCGAVLVAVRKNRLMNVIGTVERDYGMPNGAETRQKIGMDASYYWVGCITPKNVDRHIAAAKACGLKYMMLFWRTFAHTCGHFDFNLTQYPRGLEDLKAVTAKIREAGLTPGLHFHYNKVSTNDTYVVNGTPDPRLHGIRHMLLSRSLTADDTTIYLQGNPAGIVVEPVAASELAKRESSRHLVQIGEELIRYQRTVIEPPYRLEGCVRGVLGTKAAAHTAAERFRHLDVDDWPLFIRVDQDSDLQDEIAVRLAALVGECGFRFYHYDGAEDVPTPYWYNVPRAQTRVRRALGDYQIWARSASHSQYSWHSITHGSGFDMFPHERLREAVKRYWSVKAFHNNESFTTTDFGSIDIRSPDEMRQYSDGTLHRTTGMQPDHAELIGSKSLAWNGCSGLRIHNDRELDHPLFADICAVIQRWEQVRRAKSVPEDVKLMMRDASREWFIWPFDFDPNHPELVEYHQILPDETRPLRAFSFTREGKGGLVYWAVGLKDPPAIDLSASGLSVRATGARRFVTADVPEADLAVRFKAALECLK